jgi:hypothetical protein
MAGSFVGAPGDYVGMTVHEAMASTQRVKRIQCNASHCEVPPICRHFIMRSLNADQWGIASIGR